MRTPGELADWLDTFIENPLDGNVQKHAGERFGEIHNVLSALEGERRIEGWARMLDPNCSCAEARQWGVDLDCGHYDDLPSYERCTLIIQAPEEKDDG